VTKSLIYRISCPIIKQGRRKAMKTRDHVRYGVLKTAETIAETKGGIVNFTSFIMNISLRGLALRSSVYLAPETPVLVLLPFIDDDGMEDRAVLMGNVAWSAEGDRDYNAGILFTKELAPDYNPALMKCYFTGPWEI